MTNISRINRLEKSLGTKEPHCIIILANEALADAIIRYEKQTNRKVNKHDACKYFVLTRGEENVIPITVSEN